MIIQKQRTTVRICLVFLTLASMAVLGLAIIRLGIDRTEMLAVLPDLKKVSEVQRSVLFDTWEAMTWGIFISLSVLAGSLAAFGLVMYRLWARATRRSERAGF